jgi:soluble lytic murein transglycosylase-like protein
MHFARQLAGSLILLALTASAFASDIAFLRNGFSIRHERHQELGTITRLYLSADDSSYADVPTLQIDHFERDLFAPKPEPTAVSPASPQTLDQVITTTSQRHRVDPDLIASVIHAESNFNPHAVSNKGAQGLMQIMPQTAFQLGLRNAFDPKDNVEGGTRYLRELLERYNFDLIKALAAYNAGPRRVEQYGGVPPYQETRAYIARIVRDFNRKKLAEQKLQKQAAKKNPSPKSAAPSQKPTQALVETTSKQASR